VTEKEEEKVDCIMGIDDGSCDLGAGRVQKMC
jgi:hypothetical protein